MFARVRSLLRQPRWPLAGVALAAVAGILAGEAIRLLAPEIPGPALGIACALFTAAAASFFWRPRTWLCWTLLVGGFAVLHLFKANPAPATVLARELQGAAAPAHIFHAIGRIVDEPREKAKPPPAAAGAGTDPEIADWRFTFRLESITVNGRQWPCHADVLATWKEAAHKPVAGDRLTAVGLASNVADPRNPGEFDDAAYLRRRGIYSELTMNGIADVLPASADRPWWQRPIVGPLAQRVHDWLDATLRLDLEDDPEVPRLVTTILLGLRDHPGLGELEPLFQRTGTLHFFAIDGLKLGFLGWLLLAALTSAGLGRGWARAFCLLLLLGYTLAAGVGPATVRAVAVAAVLLGGEWLDRPARATNSLGAAAAALLLCDTNQLFTLGFQLSFLVVLAILTLAPPLRAWLWKLGAPDPFLPRLLYPRWLRTRECIRRAAVDLTSVAVAAGLGSAPLTMLAFHLISPISIGANIAVFPLAAAMFGLAVFAALGGVIWQTWAIWMNNANWLVAKTLLVVLRFLDGLPGSSFQVASPGFWRWPAPLAEITVLDLGPARATALRAGGGDWLLDTGRAGDYHNLVRPFLAAWGVARLDGLLLTTGDTYHLGGAVPAMAELRPEQVLLSGLPGRSPFLREVRAALAARQPAAPLAEGTVLTLAPQVSLRVLYPPADLTPAAAAGRAVIFRLDAGGWRILFLGDSNAEARAWLAAHQPPADLRSDAVVIGRPLEPGALLSSIRPRLVIRQRTRDESGVAAPGNESWRTWDQQQAGAVTLRLYADRLEAATFLDGKRTKLTPPR